MIKHPKAALYRIEFNSRDGYRDNLKNWVNLYRLIRNSGDQTENDKFILGFLTHCMNNANYVSHREIIDLHDLLFLIYYSTKACHKLKRHFFYLPHIRKELDEFIQFAKSESILDENDYAVWAPIPGKFLSHNKPP